jgi:short-subunit dehydrogenase
VELRGAVVLVTGASSGIGRACAATLARRGARVKLTGRDKAALSGAARLAGGGDALAADLASAGGIDSVVAWAGGDVDVLVNNAGLGWTGAFADMNAHDAEELIRVNLLAPVRLTAALLPGMLARRRGHIVNVASIVAHVGVPTESVYAATKWGLAGFTESLRAELAGTNVGVSLVSPGPVRTSFLQRRGLAYDRAFPRPVSPERVADAIARAIATGASDVFVPGWLAVPARLRGSLPRLYRRLAARFG